ncbi:MAG: S-layer homology domain-containing protein [Oscillospiraceae bacterium]|nr:S-layer homology domain-containing protein [Oscillospiraceae bacterium]
MNKIRNLYGKLVSILLVALMLVGVAPAELLAPIVAKADGAPVGDVIFDEPYATPPPFSDASSIDWTVIDHPLYDDAYTVNKSREYNDVETPKHVVISGDDISFYGYYSPPYVDSVFTDIYDVNGISFVLVPHNMNFHSFSESGFLFNGEFEYIGSKLYYTGYAVILKCGNVAGMMENDPNANNLATLCLYYIEKEEWNSEYFTPGNVTTTRTLISVIKTGIQNLDTTPYKIDIDLDSATRAFDVYIDGLLRASLSAADVEGGATGGIGFGCYTGYYSHSCSILTRISFENTKFDIDQTENPTKATVYFVAPLLPKGKDEIRPPEVADGTSSHKYRIVQPQFIEADDPNFVYVLSGNSRTADISNDIILTYQTYEERNKTTLYYTLTPGADINIDEYREKKARVNGGAWDNGSATDPVLVSFGDEIEYMISVYKLAGGQAQQGDYGEIRDTIPNGLTIDELSITGVNSNDPIAGTITWKLEDSGRKIVWTIPNEMYPVSVSVKVTVEYPTSSWSASYENTAIVDIGVGSVTTNTTYHEYTHIKVVEEYYLFDEVTDTTTGNKLPYPDLVTYFREGNQNQIGQYTVKGLDAEKARMYIFRGYDYNGTFIGAKSISDIDLPYYEDEFYSLTIKLYYMPVYVTIHFVDENGDPIDPSLSVKEMVLPLSDYYIKNSYYNSFVFNNKTWNYYDFAPEAPVSGTGKLLGTVPVYPPAGPIFKGSDMGGSQHITLYFTDKLAVRVNFKELSNPYNILCNPMTVFFDTEFDPELATRPGSGDGLSDDIDLAATSGKLYEYVSAYSINGGPIQDGFPGICEVSCEITLYFKTTYTLIEKYHKSDTNEVDLELQSDETTPITGGGSFSGNPPPTIPVGADTWKYIGYKVDLDINPLNPGYPSISNLTGDIVIIYVYEKSSGGGNGGGTTPGVEIPDDEGPESPFITDHVAYIIGYPDGSVRPESNVTRAEVATVFFRLLTDEFRGDYWTRDNPYQDSSYSDWFNIAVSVMNKMEIITGYPDGLFKPNAAITRAELAAVAARFANIMQMSGSNIQNFSDIGGHWAEADIDYAAVIGWVNGYPDGTYGPNQPITRAEFMTLVNRVLERAPENDGDLLDDDMVHWPDNKVSSWYYLAVQEATNSHDFEDKGIAVPGLGFNYERWVAVGPNPDWLALETVWKETY